MPQPQPSFLEVDASTDYKATSDHAAADRNRTVSPYLPGKDRKVTNNAGRMPAEGTRSEGAGPYRGLSDTADR